MAHPGSALDGRAVAELAAGGDLDATAIVESAARAVARAVRSCIAILDPDAVVFGGGIGAADGRLVRTMCRELDVCCLVPIRRRSVRPGLAIAPG